ncbi:MAG: inositol monophosphatase [Tyzzerella sp.]|nr:inositol monophosphatase [Tyzzerella sp.]
MNIDFTKIKEIILQTDSIIFDPELLNQVTVKGPADYVTLVDKNVQTYLQTALSTLYPDIDFMGEEKDNTNIDFTGDVWIIDPIDGTTNLIQNCNFSAVSVGLWNGKKQKIELGIIYQPFTKEFFHAIDGQGAFLNGVPIRVSTKTELKNCIISAGSTPYHKEYADEVFKITKNMYLNCSDIRQTGSAALDIAYVACGRLDGYFEKILSPWDYAAGHLILKEAGGHMTDYYGKAPTGTHISSVCCSNSLVHEQMMDIIQNC